MKITASRVFLIANPGWIALISLLVLVIRADRRPDLIFNLAALGAFIGVAGLFAVNMAIRGRISRLATAAQQIRASADFGARIPEVGPRRYRALAGEINGMLGTLQRIHEKLQHLNNDLESRVRERTSELEASKQALAEDATRRIESERLNAERERIYRTMHDLSPSGIMISTDDGVALEVNQAVCDLLGYRRDEMVGRNVAIFAHPEERGRVTANLARLLGGETLFHEVRSIRKDGSTRFVELHERAITLPNGERRIITTANDITARRAAEEKLRRTDLRYRAMFNTMWSGFALFEVVVDEKNHPADLVILEVNPALTKITGRARGDLIGRRFGDAYPQEKDTWVARLAQVAQTGQGATYNEPTEFMGKLASITLHSPQPGQVAAIIADITEQKRTQAQLHLQSIALDSAANGIMIVGLDGVIQWANRAMSTLSGYSTSELVGSSTRIFKAGKQSPEFYRNMWNTISSGRAWRGEMINKRKDGSLSTEEMTITPVMDQQGKTLSFIAIKQDIGEQRSLQQQLAQSQKMEVVGRLAGGIAHDFNNLLQAITGFTHLLLDSLGEDSPHRSDALEIEKAARRATDLTRQLLAFSRRQMIKPVPINLNELTAGLQKILQRLIGSDIQIELDLTPDVDLVLADPGQIEQVLINLALNARDAMPKGGRLSIATRNIVFLKEDAPFTPDARYGRFVTLSVTDTGQGIPPEIREQIFEPFFTTKGPDRGSGLGLPVVYGIIQQHEGMIRVYSEQGRGTTVTTYIPVALAADETAADVADTAPTPAKIPRGRGERILLVEDEPGVRDFTLSALRQYGYQPYPADNCAAAEEIFATAQQPFDLLFTDVVLPDKTGLDLADSLRQRQPNLRLLFSSGYMDEKSRWSVIRDQGYPFLQKPYALSQLLFAIRSTLDLPPPA